MRFKRSFMSICLSVVFLTYTGIAQADDSVQSGWSLPSSAQNNIAGDDAYWGTSNTDDTPDSAKWSEGSISADGVGKESSSQADKVPRIRADAIEGAAMGFGTQAGMANRADKINKALKVRQGYYDKVFNFSVLQLEPGFLPPVISEGVDAYNQPSDDEVRAADHIYKIEFPAKIVNVVPRWQEYLFVPFGNPDVPDKSILPKTSAEKDLWNEYVSKGWSIGEKQANEEFEGRLARLKRDYEGMLRYKKLYEKGMVSKPVIARSSLGTTGGGDQMAVGDRVIKITNKAQLNPNQQRWMSGSGE